MITELKRLFETTDLTQDEIGDKLNLTRKQIWRRLTSLYSKEELRERKRRCYAKSKLGSKNPMYGKYGESHHQYIGQVSDGKGYLLILKPDWYAGRKGTKYIFYHHYVMCKHLGITEIPKGFVIHHKDFDPHNNAIENLELLSNSEHMKLHALIRQRATTNCTSEANADGSARHLESTLNGDIV